jgi:hypothetical protein
VSAAATLTRNSQGVRSLLSAVPSIIGHVELTAVPFAIADELRPMASALTFLSDGRYRLAGPDERAVVLIVLPSSGAEIRALRQRDPDRAIVVWDRAESAAPASIAADLDAGADAYVTGANVPLLICYVDALQRRASVAPV